MTRTLPPFIRKLATAAALSTLLAAGVQAQDTAADALPSADSAKPKEPLPL